MKTNATRIFLIRAILFMLLSLYFLAVFGQEGYAFKNATLESGSSLQTGAVYRFQNVKQGVDATVTIINLTGGTTLTAIDDNSIGFSDAFQPFINVPPGANGYAEFKIDFTITGTSTLMNQEYIPATCMNVTGINYADGKISAMDQVQLINGHCDFNLSGLNLEVLSPPGWITIKNTSASTHPVIDTMSKEAMATVSNFNISSINIRVGAQNTSATRSDICYRGVYFKSFQYPASILLPNRTLLNFSGIEKNNGIELKGVLAPSHSYDKLIIEKGSSSSYLEQIAQLEISGTNSANYSFSYYDNSPYAAGTFYRIRLVNSRQNIYELSSVLMVKKNTDMGTGLKIYNNVLKQNDPAIILQSHENSEAIFQLFDMNGHYVYSCNKKVYAGVNNVSFSDLHITPGYFILVTSTATEINKQKVILQ